MVYRTAILFVSVFLIVACRTDPPADLVIRGANIVDVATGSVSEGRTLEIRDGKIAKIYDSDDGIHAKNILQASGKYIIPGLWDMHVHFRGGDSLAAQNKELLPLFIENGITTVRDAGGDITKAILEWRKEIEAGKLVGPHIYTSGPKLDGPDPRWTGSLPLSTVDQVPAAFDSLESLNVDYVKLYDSTIPPDVYLAAVEEAGRRGLPVTGHMPFTVDFNETVAAGLDATEHMYYVLKGSSSEEEKVTEAVRKGEYGFWKALSGVMATYDQQTAEKTYRQMAEAGTGVVPTLHIGKVLAYLNEKDHTDDAYLRNIPEGIRKTYRGRLQAARSQSEEATQRRRNLRAHFIQMIPDLHDAGVTIYAGSDSGPYNSFVYPGISLHKELQELVAAGLSPLEALQTSVRNGPKFFGVSDSYGRVQEGYAADMLLLNGNPLNNIENTQNIHTVILQGRVAVPSEAF